MGCIHADSQAAVPVKNRLKVLRAENDWSQAELADRIGVARQTIVALEAGKYAPSLPLAFKLSKLFSKPVEEIFDPESAE
jgi:putative transcriptional regulator